MVLTSATAQGSKNWNTYQYADILQNTPFGLSNLGRQWEKHEEKLSV